MPAILYDETIKCRWRVNKDLLLMFCLKLSPRICITRNTFQAYGRAIEYRKVIWEAQRKIQCSTSSNSQQKERGTNIKHEIDHRYQLQKQFYVMGNQRFCNKLATNIHINKLPQNLYLKRQTFLNRRKHYR